MFVICTVDVAEAIALFYENTTFARMTPAQCKAFCQERGFLALVAEEDDMYAGLAIAESTPKALHVLKLEGCDDACRLLLERLMRIAGERDVSGRCQADQAGMREMFQAKGFLELFQEGCQCYYYWDRNSSC